MKKILLLLVCVISMSSAFGQNRWSVYAGGNLNHIVTKNGAYSDKGKTHYDWGGGAFIGGAFELNFNNHWSFSPALEFSYNDNGAYYANTGEPVYNIYGYEGDHIWAGAWAVNIPLTVGFRFPVSDFVKFKIDAGAYLSEAFHVTHYLPEVLGTHDKIDKRKATNNFDHFFQTGFVGSVAVETGNHFSYFFRTQYPFLKGRFTTNVLTLSIGAKYTF